MMGVYRNLLRDFHYIVYVILLMAIVIVFPIPVYLRLIFSVYPFYLYFTFQGLMEAEAILRRGGLNRKWPLPQISWDRLAAWSTGKPVQLRPSRFVHAFCFFVLALFVFRTSADALSNMKKERVKLNGPYSPNSQQMLSFIKASTPPEAVIIFREPRVMGMFTQRQSLRVTKLAAIEAGKGDFLVYHHRLEGYQVSFKELEQIKSRYPVLFENEDYLVLQLKYLPGSAG
jgi:hypothetical protein